jgi:AcrR family transcriptional regulator
VTAASKTPPSRARNADATRADLLRAAKRRFTVLGYERTTTRDIAADAGANVSLITRYFGSKEGLFAAVVSESAEALDQATVQDPRDLVEQILSSLQPEAWAEYGGENPLVLLSRDSGEGEQVKALRQKGLRTAVEHFATELDARAGRRRPDPERQLRAELLLAFLTGLVTVRAALPDGELATASDETLRAVLQRVVDGSAA